MPCPRYSSKAGLVGFRKERLKVDVALRKTGGAFHDRFVVIDCGMPDERVFLCGASSEDAGKRATAIMGSSLTGLYHDMAEELLANLGLKLGRGR